MTHTAVTGERLGGLLPALAALLAAVPAAVLIHAVYARFPERPDYVVAFAAALAAAVLAAVCGLLLRRRPVTPQRLGLSVLATVAILLLASYFFWLSFFLRFPADLLMYAESDYVGNIIKWRTGYPIYSPPENNESQVYPPLSSLLTWLIASAFGAGASVPAYRAVQAGYTLAASLLAFLCWRRLMRMGESEPEAHGAVWRMLALPFFFLVASNYLTNPFAQNLHPDALVQLTSLAAYWLLLEHLATGNDRLLIPMAVLPGVGFMVKQNVAIWALFYTAYVAAHAGRRSRTAVVAFAACAFGGIAAAVGVGYALWGEPFRYWVLQVLAGHGTSNVRAFEHLREGWLYLALGLSGGAALLRGRAAGRLFLPWAIWFLLFASEVYTSGIGFPLSHMGPGSLLAAVWFLAAAPLWWKAAARCQPGTPAWLQWVPAGICAPLLGVAIFQGAALVRMPLPPFSPDAYRYVAEIEREFARDPAACTLMDAGSWVYLRPGIVMKDRAPAIGDRGMDGSGDFTAFRKRIEQRRYCKILVRNYASDRFWYDFPGWPKSSGLRQAMRENYREVRRIKAVAGLPVRKEFLAGTGALIFFDEITVLVPLSR